MIDAGHGGHDPGAPAASGGVEKDVTLAIAKAAKAAIEKRARAQGVPVEVRLTRDDDRFVLRDYEERGSAGDRLFVGRVAVDGEERSISGRGNGLISGVIAALADTTGPALDVADYSEHAIGHGADAQAAAYVECRTADGRTVFGVGMDSDIATASVRAVLSAANRAHLASSAP